MNSIFPVLLKGTVSQLVIAVVFYFRYRNIASPGTVSDPVLLVVRSSTGSCSGGGSGGYKKTNTFYLRRSQ